MSEVETETRIEIQLDEVDLKETLEELAALDEASKHMKGMIPSDAISRVRFRTLETSFRAKVHTLDELRTKAQLLWPLCEGEFSTGIAWHAASAQVLKYLIDDINELCGAPAATAYGVSPAK